MSGIVGVFNRNGEPVRHETLVSMCEAINHRGPHSRGIWTDGPVGFGHVLLHTTEESLREKQPLSFDGKVWITADARIDDRDGLIDLLKSHVQSGEDLHQETDVALLLHAYHAWGVGCVKQIIGVFGAAIWDGRARRLICLRDHIGIKPFYYAYTPKHLVFASEVKGILASRLVPQHIYEPRIADYLVQQLEGIDKICTFFENIVRLPPAHCLICNGKNVNLKQYWTLDPTREIRYKDQRDYNVAFKEIFYEAVRPQLRGAKPVASMLSGGLDSSSIVTVSRDVLAKENRPNLSIFSLVNNADPACQETLHIKHLIAQGGLKSFTIDVEKSTEYLDDVTEVYQKPDDLFDLVMPFLQIIYRKVKAQDMSVLLDGVDGDLVMGQPGNHIAYLLQNFRFKEALKEAHSTRSFYYQFPNSTLWYLYGAIRAAFIPKSLRSLKSRGWCFGHNQTISSEIKDSIISRKFAERVDLLNRLAVMHSYRINAGRINLRRSHISALEQPYLTAALERYDRIASKFSVEPRHPILDRRLVEFFVSIPWDQKVREGWTKILTRQTLINLLPDEVAWRRGREHLGGKIIIGHLQSNFSEIKEFIENNFSRIESYVEWPKIKRLLNQNRLGSNSERFESADQIMAVHDLIVWVNHWYQK